jgi:hypothetical protein
MPGWTRLSSSKESSPFCWSHRFPGDGVEGHPEAVAHAVGEDLLDIRAGLAATGGARREEGVVGGRRAVVEAQHDPGQVRVVRLGPAELVVGGRRCRSRGEILQLAAAAIVPKDHVELAVGPKDDHAAVVVACRALGLVPLTGRLGRPVVLERAEHEQVAVEHQSGVAPDEPVDPVAEQGHLKDVAGVWSQHVGVQAPPLVGEERIGRRRRAAAAPEQVDPGVRREVGVQRDPEQAALGGEVDREVEHDALDGAVRHAEHVPGVLLEHQHVVGPEEGDAGRRREWTGASTGTPLTKTNAATATSEAPSFIASLPLPLRRSCGDRGLQHRAADAWRRRFGLPILSSQIRPPARPAWRSASSPSRTNPRRYLP